MKEVKAYIKQHMLTKVTSALHKVEGLTGMSVVDVHGFGRQRGEKAKEKRIIDEIEYVPHAKLEIICEDDLVDDVVNAIQRAAHTGLRGDGKIYVSNVEQAVRISTGEKGNAAV